MNTRTRIVTLIVLFFAAVLSACGGATPSGAPSFTRVVKETVVVETTKEVEKEIGATLAPAATQAPEATKAPEPTTASAPAQNPSATPAATATPMPTPQPTGFATEPVLPTPESTRVPATPTAMSTAVPSETPVPAPTRAPAAETLAPSPTGAPAVIATAPATPAPQVTQAVRTEGRLVELEWPPRMRLGDSDVVRLALVPSQEGYTVTAEFPEHQVVTKTVTVRQISGYDLSAVARLDGVSFDIAPEGEQVRDLPEGALDPITWHWTLTPRAAGQQRLAVRLALRWAPTAGSTGATHETVVYSKGLNVDVVSFLGLTTGQTATTGLMGLVAGGGLSALALLFRRRPARAVVRELSPNPALVIEPRPGLQLALAEDVLLRTLFRRYGRLVIENEFRSGYSGARTLLALPIRPDGRADAYTIAKIGDRESIRREFENYETFVKDTLPPITARIQEPPVSAPERKSDRRGDAKVGLDRQAVVRYTFIGEPGRNPVSLREALLSNPDPTLLRKLFETFGPNWWMQRRPYAFRMAQEYDRVLPAHYVIEPASGHGRPVDGHTPPGDLSLQIGDCVSLSEFATLERRADGRSLSLTGSATPGQPPLRVRWLSVVPPHGGTAGRIVGTRDSLLRDYARGFDLCGLPDPLANLQTCLAESVAGSQSTIHGDLNLENVLVGPGGFVWLIDFAQTRDGHTLYDFAHLEAQVIAHVIAPQLDSVGAYLALLNDPNTNPALHALRSTLHDIAARCLFNPTQPREYQLALYLACLGALKFNNLQAFPKQLLYLTAARVGQSL